jgi:hypothetical protein
MTRKLLGLGVAIVGGALITITGSSLAQQATGGAAGSADVKVPAGVATKANSPTPPAKATKKAAIGKGKAAANTANAGDDTDSFWIEEIDIDGDGKAEATDILWDDEDKVLFLYAEGEFPCQGGGTGSGDMLIAINGNGNPRGRPAGSGWFLVTLDEGECKAKAAGAYGCKFDAKGIVTACGAAVVDEKNDELVVSTASQ